MRVFIEIENVLKGCVAAKDIADVLPSEDALREFAAALVPAILPVKFRLIKHGSPSPAHGTIEFAEDK